MQQPIDYSFLPGKKGTPYIDASKWVKERANTQQSFSADENWRESEIVKRTV
jgi:hypothetical protein